MNLPTLPQVLGYGALGCALGLAHFGLLRWNVRLYLDGRGKALALQLLRVAATAAALAALARLGAWPLLLGLAGWQLGRALLLHRARTA